MFTDSWCKFDKWGLKAMKDIELFSKLLKASSKWVYNLKINHAHFSDVSEISWTCSKFIGKYIHMSKKKGKPMSIIPINWGSIWWLMLGIFCRWISKIYSVTLQPIIFAEGDNKYRRVSSTYIHARLWWQIWTDCYWFSAIFQMLS